MAKGYKVNCQLISTKHKFDIRIILYELLTSRSGIFIKKNITKPSNDDACITFNLGLDKITI